MRRKREYFKLLKMIIIRIVVWRDCLGIKEDCLGIHEGCCNLKMLIRG